MRLFLVRTGVVETVCGIFAILILLMATKTKSNKSRTYARNRPVVSRRGLENIFEPDGVYLFKLILTTLAGLMWLRLADPVMLGIVPIGAFPLGALVALLLISRFEHAQFNRKILYAVLVVVTIIGFFLNAGIVL